MKIFLKPVLAILLTFFAVNCIAEDEAAVDLVTTTIEQPAAPVKPVANPAPVVPQLMSDSKPAANSSNSSTIPSAPLLNQDVDMKKYVEMVSSLLSQVKEMQGKTIEMNMTLQSLEGMAKANNKIVMACLIALLVLSLALLFKKCSCRAKADDITGK